MKTEVHAGVGDPGEVRGDGEARTPRAFTLRRPPFRARFALRLLASLRVRTVMEGIRHGRSPKIPAATFLIGFATSRLTELNAGDGARAAAVHGTDHYSPGCSV